jgi:hypothetical protein
MESALSTISVLPSNRKEMEAFKWDIKRDLKGGVVKNPLEVKVKLTILKDLISEILEDDEVDEVFLKEYHLYSEKIVKVNGAELTEREVGVKYAYEDSGDPNWNFLTAEFKKVSELKKKREKFLQTLDEKGTVDPETGVFITRPPKSSKTKVVCTLR